MKLTIKSRFIGDEFRAVTYPNGGGYKNVKDLQRELLRRWKGHPTEAYEKHKNGVVIYYRNPDTGKATNKIKGYVTLEKDGGAT